MSSRPPQIRQRRRRSRLSAGAVLAGVFQAGLTAVVGYLGLLTYAAFRASRAPSPAPTCRQPRTTRFVVLVPAHNEEVLVADTVRSLLDVDYPDHCRHVVVVADHCTDMTAQHATSAGAEVLHHDDPEPPGKGDALQWAFEQLERRGHDHDVVVIVDADSVVNECFFRAIDEQFARGARVVQTRYGVRDCEASDSTRLRSAALALRHHTRPLGRVAIGGSCGLFGNGMAFSADVLRDHSWTEHLTEDLEFQISLLLDGIRVDYAPDAVVLAEMPSTLEDATSQNERWERGRIELARRLIPDLIRRALVRRSSQRRRAFLDAAADLAVPPLSVVAGAVCVSAAATGATAAVRRSPKSWGWVTWSVGIAAAFLTHVAVGLRIAEVPPSVYRSLARAPRMIAWKLALWSRMVTARSDVHWTRTQRNAEAPPQ